LSLGNESSSSENAIYIRGNGGTQLVVGVDVDDLVITGSSNGDIKAFREEMAGAFRMSDLGPLHYYLSIEVKPSAGGNFAQPRCLRQQDLGEERHGRV
jgi:hypothetical protein